LVGWQLGCMAMRYMKKLEFGLTTVSLTEHARENEYY